MKFLLIEPESNHKAPNLGLLYLSASLAKAEEDVLLLDLNNGPKPADPVERVVRLLDDHEVDLLGVSICDVNMEWVLDLLGKVRAQRPVKVVAGGPHVNSLGPSILEDHPELDMALYGECESSALTFLGVMAQKGPLEKVPGLIFRNGQIRTTPKQGTVSLNHLAQPDYGHLGIEKLPAYMLLTSRGCPYHCSFCCRNTGSVWRPRELDDCLSELKQAKAQLCIESFRIVDASFNIKEKRVLEFCRRLEEEEIDLPWMVSGIRADRLTQASVAALKRAGCQMLAVGVESIDPQVFAQIDKGETLEQIFTAIEMCKRLGLEVGCYMVHGLPGDNFERSVHYARRLQELEPDYVMYNHAIPFVGTELHRWVATNGHINPKFSWLNTRDFDSVGFWTDDFNERERLDSFRVIQTITHVINFNGQNPEEFDSLLDEVKRYDPSHLDYHKRYLERCLAAKGGDKNKFRLIHQEDKFVHRSGYTGCVELNSGRMV